MMKLIIVALTITIAACNSTSEKSENTKNLSQTDSTVTIPTNEPGMMNHDTSTSSASMMSLMQKMMTDMKAISTTNNPDNDFAAFMKAHHLGALQMAQAEVDKGKDEELKKMAGKMIEDQQKEILELNNFLSGHKAHGGGDAFYKEAMAAMDKMNMEMDHSGSLDKQFAQMMVPHHQSAIDMAKAYIKAGAHEEKLKTMANNIIASQQKEIAEMKNWLSKN